MKGYRLKSAKWKKACGAKSRDWQASGGSFQWIWIGMYLMLLKWCITKYVQCCQPGILTQTLVTRVSTRYVSCRHPHDWPQLVRLQSHPRSNWNKSNPRLQSLKKFVSGRIFPAFRDYLPGARPRASLKSVSPLEWAGFEKPNPDKFIATEW